MHSLFEFLYVNRMYLPLPLSFLPLFGEQVTERLAESEVLVTSPLRGLFFFFSYMLLFVFKLHPQTPSLQACFSTSYHVTLIIHSAIQYTLPLRHLGARYWESCWEWCASNLSSPGYTLRTDYNISHFKS